MLNTLASHATTLHKRLTALGCFIPHPIHLYVVILVAFPEDPLSESSDLCGGGGFPEDGWRLHFVVSRYSPRCFDPFCGDCTSLSQRLGATIKPRSHDV